MNNVALWYRSGCEDHARDISTYINTFAFNSWLLPLSPERTDDSLVKHFLSCNFMIVLLSKEAEDLATHDFRILEKHFPKGWYQIIIPCRLGECAVPEILSQYHIVDYANNRSDLIAALNDNCSENAEFGNLFYTFSSVFYDLNNNLGEANIEIPIEIMNGDLEVMQKFLQQGHLETFNLLCRYHIDELRNYVSHVSQNPYFVDHQRWHKKELTVYHCRLISVHLNLVFGQVLSSKNRAGMFGTNGLPAASKYVPIILYGNMIFDSISGMMTYLEQASAHWMFCKKALTYLNACLRAIFNHMSEFGPEERTSYKYIVGPLSQKVVNLMITM